MGASSRHLHPQSAKLTRGRAIGAAIFVACLISLSVVAWPGQGSASSASLMDGSEWLEIALRMESAGVPPRELLGAPLQSETLLSYLDVHGIGAESFRVTSERIRENAIHTVIAADDRTQSVLAEMPEAPDFGLPRGVQLPRFDRLDGDRRPEPEMPRISPELHCAQRLLDSLAAPLQEDDR